MTSRVERLSEFVEELKSLVDDHWDEVGSFKQAFRRHINYARYLKQDAAGMLLCVTARGTGGGLDGYIIGVLGEDFHRVATNGTGWVKAASGIVYYMRPEARGHAREMVQEFERAAVERGCELVHHRAKPGLNQAGEFFEAIGYVVGEIGYSKIVGDARAHLPAAVVQQVRRSLREQVLQHHRRDRRRRRQ